MPRPSRSPKPHDGSARDPWERRAPEESAKAFAAFQRYCKQGGDRSLVRVAAELGRSPRLMQRWSSDYEWVARASAYDTRMAGLEQDRQERVRVEYAEKWERRRMDAREANWDRAQRLAVRAEEMLKAPLFEQEVTQTMIDPATGREIPVAVTFTPAKWTFATAGAILKLAAELQAAAVADALGGQDDDGFDPLTATPDECRAYLEKQGAMKGLPAPAGGKAPAAGGGGERGEG